MQIDNLLLRGVVGSTAYGLNHADSDTDYQGVYAVDTKQLLGLDLPDLEKAVEYKNPDTKYYEALHYARLALKSNPSILELMWLNEYDVITPAGRELIAIRNAFPTQKYVKAAYLGYANQQYSKLLKDERRHKRAKNARHFARLLYQGRTLYRTGVLQIALPNPYAFINFGEEVADGNLDRVQKALNYAEEVFDQPSALPEEPDREAVNFWLLGVRNGFFKN